MPGAGESLSAHAFKRANDPCWPKLNDRSVNREPSGGIKARWTVRDPQQPLHAFDTLGQLTGHKRQLDDAHQPRGTSSVAGPAKQQRPHSTQAKSVRQAKCAGTIEKPIVATCRSPCQSVR